MSGATNLSLSPRGPPVAIPTPCFIFVTALITAGNDPLGSAVCCLPAQGKVNAMKTARRTCPLTVLYIIPLASITSLKSWAFAQHRSFAQSLNPMQGEVRNPAPGREQGEVEAKREMPEKKQCDLVMPCRAEEDTKSKLACFPGITPDPTVTPW